MSQSQESFVHSQFQFQSQSQKLSINEFNEVLRPVREFSVLWQIPLSDYLDHYMTDIETSSISDGSQNSEVSDIPELNFSQAGLFLQGSTNIFARKVQHLYNLVLNSKSEEDSNDSDGKRRKRKTVNWVHEDKLVEIEDPEEVNTILLPNDETNFETTLLPKIPFCLLNSLENPISGQNSESFRVDLIPDSEFTVIILDRSHKFGDLFESVIEGDDRIENDCEFPAPEFSDAIEMEFEHSERSENHDLTPPLLPDISESSENDEIEIQLPKIRSQQEFQILNEETNKLSFASRAFKKMSKKKLRFPTTFGENKIEKKTITKRPFHENIFAEIFEKVKSFRKRKIVEADRQILANLPKESGRDHVLENIEIYVEPPPIPDDETEEEIPLPSLPFSFSHPTGIPSTFNWRSSGFRDNYSQLCQQFVRMMVERGDEKVVRPSSNRILIEWERRLTPTLENELKRKPFNVEEIREWIKTTLKSHKGEMTFRCLSSGLQTHEISRVFLSVLMLANTHEVILDRTSSSMDNEEFVIKLNKENGFGQRN
jgi:condensin-2 complex subunit H2